jgi:hypothetical protein
VLFFTTAIEIQEFRMFVFLRLIRGFFGFLAGLQVFGILPALGWLQDIGSVNSNMVAIFVVKLLFMCIAFGAFLGLRSLINKMHTNRHGTQHPALVKKWAL